jgi:hypothetical protein
MAQHIAMSFLCSSQLFHRSRHSRLLWKPKSHHLCESSDYRCRNFLPSGMRCRLKRCQRFHAKDGGRNLLISLYIFNIIIQSTCRPSKQHAYSVDIYQQNCIHLTQSCIMLRLFHSPHLVTLIVLVKSRNNEAL